MTHYCETANVPSNLLTKMLSSCNPFAEDALDLQTEPTSSSDTKHDTTSLDSKTQFTNTQDSFPPVLDTNYWQEPSALGWNVRSSTYLKSKLKYPATNNLFQLLAVDLIQLQNSKPVLSGLSTLPKERISQYIHSNTQQKKSGKKGSAHDKNNDRPFVFVVNITVPGTVAYHLVMYYAIHDKRLIQKSNGHHPSASTNLPPLTPEQKAFQTIASEFFFGSSDKYRDERFKLIPKIISGNILVKKAVGSKPTLLGKKVKQYYIRSNDYFELIVDVGSDAIAKKVVGLCTGYAKNLVVDMGFVLEGTSEEELPEVVMGSVRLKNIDFKAARKVNL